MTFKNILLTLITASALSLTACNSDEKQIDDKNSTKIEVETSKGSTSPAENNNLPVYKVATLNTYAPFATTNEHGNLTGFDIDVIKAIGEVQGFKPEFVSHDWKKWKSDLKTEAVDLWAAGIAIKEERKEIAAFTDSYLDDNTALLTIITTDGNSVDTADISELKVGTEKSSEASTLAKKIIKNGSNIQEFSSNFIALENLVQGNIQGIIGNELVLANMTNQFPEFKFKLKTLPNQTEHTKLAFMLNKNNDKLAKKINTGLATIKENGKLDEIKKKWFGNLVK